MNDSDDIVKEFLVESYENLDRLDRDLVELEKHPSDQEILASVFRTIHTIKGTSGFLAFSKLEAVAHVGENLLARLRDGQLTLSPEITTALLAMVDAVRHMLGSIEATGNEGERNDQELIATLTRLLQPKAEPNPAPDPAPAKEEAQQNDAPHPVPSIGDILIKRGAAKVSEVYDAVEQQKAGDPRHVGEILVEKGAVKPQDVLEALNVQQQARGQSASDSTIRVDVNQLDRLMNRVGELVLLRNQIVQFTNSSEDSGLLATSQRLNLITTELQEGVMKTRMQPIGNIWSKFPRTVRDVALGCGKQVRIEMEGKETELDKTIIEAVKDPLTHIVRNSVDHGIESPEARIAAGKNPEGRLFLRAFHEGGQVNIEITDDGAGLDYEKIRTKAMQKALVSADQAARMTEREITNLIFLPGFSTAEKVTNVSGRGVGMDVVKTNIEKIGGTVDVQSKPGQGSTVRMKIPLTLAIIPALIVTTTGDRYAIPQVSLLELVRLEGEQARKGIELVNGAPVHRLRGQLLPLVYLNRELKADAQAQDAAAAPTTSSSKWESLDFTQARHKHEQWIGRLRQLLDGKTTMTVEQAGSPTECALGKWLYSAGLKDYGSIDEMQALEATHKHFHELVREIVVLNVNGNQSQAQREFSKVEPLSKKIIELLTVVEKKALETQNANIVVLRAGDQQFGLVVDEINDTEEIVVKPLSKQLKSVNAYAGATIMGDGRVALILDVLGLAQRAHVVSEVRDRALAEKEGKQSLGVADGNQRNAVLLFQYGENGRMAIDLSLVARLEEFPRDTIEVAGDQEAVQYRGQIMPLVWVSEVLQTKRRKAAEAGQESLHVVVYADQGRSVGLVVDRILDIVEESFVMQRQTERKGVLGSAVIQKRVTDILDVPGLIAAADGSQLSAGVQT
ncbi:MAG: chemotaxis protein CheW [Acidobacteriales bacterium]|nr:chemotaxis protein CheW [Terriglobales bacterium]